jgi:hypothetical protein
MDSPLNQSIQDWHTGHVTLSAAKGLVFRRDASPPAQHDSRDHSRARCTNVVWFDLARAALPAMTDLLPLGHYVVRSVVSLRSFS